MLDVESHQDYLTLIFVEKVSPAVALIAQMWPEYRGQKYLQWPLLGVSLASLGHFVTFHKYQEYGNTENIVPNIVPFSSLKQLRKQKKAAPGRGLSSGTFVFEAAKLI